VLVLHLAEPLEACERALLSDVLLLVAVFVVPQELASGRGHPLAAAYEPAPPLVLERP
jgi:hypothetical protein